MKNSPQPAAWCPRCQHPHDSENVCEFNCLICMNEFFSEALKDDEYLDIELHNDGGSDA